jgi:hypothetical protein
VELFSDEVREGEEALLAIWPQQSATSLYVWWNICWHSSHSIQAPQLRHLLRRHVVAYIGLIEFAFSTHTRHLDAALCTLSALSAHRQGHAAPLPSHLWAVTWCRWCSEWINTKSACSKSKDVKEEERAGTIAAGPLLSSEQQVCPIERGAWGCAATRVASLDPLQANNVCMNWPGRHTHSNKLHYWCNGWLFPDVVLIVFICVWADDVTSKYEALLKVFCFPDYVVLIVFCISCR